MNLKNLSDILSPTRQKIRFSILLIFILLIVYFVTNVNFSLGPNGVESPAFSLVELFLGPLVSTNFVEITSFILEITVILLVGYVLSCFIVGHHHKRASEAIPPTQPQPPTS